MVRLGGLPTDSDSDSSSESDGGMGAESLTSGRHAKKDHGKKPKDTEEEMVILRYVTHTGFMTEGPNELGHQQVGLGANTPER